LCGHPLQAFNDLARILDLIPTTVESHFGNQYPSNFANVFLLKGPARATCLDLKSLGVCVVRFGPSMFDYRFEAQSMSRKA
jgi:hypothetical protein